MHIALVPGSFDPFTLGHLDLVRRAASLTDRVIVGVAHNPSKRHTLDLQTRTEVIEESVKHAGLSASVSVAALRPGLLVRAAAELGVTHIVKGVRGAHDLTYEEPMARMNRELGGFDTLFLMTDPSYSHVSSSLVREIHALGGDVQKYLPEASMRALSQATPAA